MKKQLLVFAFILLTLLQQAVLGQSTQTSVAATYSNITISGSSCTWSNMGNAGISDDIYATPASSLPGSGNYTDYLQATNFSFSIPDGSTITGISVSVERSDDNGKTKDHRVRIVKGGVIGVTDKSVNTVWNITDATQTYGSSIDLWGDTWLNADLNSSNFGFAIAAKRNGGGPQVTLSKIDLVSVTIYYTPPGSLPVQLVKFDIQQISNSIEVSWSTMAEVNNDYFVLEKSIDGKEFDAFKTIDGFGNTTQISTYKAVDTYPEDGLIFYRLKQVDFDGNEIVYPGKSLYYNNPDEGGLLLFPNPASTNEDVYVSAHIPDPCDDAVLLLQLSDGRVQSVFHINTFGDRQSAVFSLSSYPIKRGIYFVLWIGCNKHLISKLMVF